jgi:hypothetical protein
MEVSVFGNRAGFADSAEGAPSARRAGAFPNLEACDQSFAFCHLPAPMRRLFSCWHPSFWSFAEFAHLAKHNGVEAGFSWDGDMAAFCLSFQAEIQSLFVKYSKKRH